MKIGFIGLGLMGRGMAANLQKAGFDLVVHDLVKDAAAPFVNGGAVWADTLKDMAEQVDVVFTSLPKPSDVEAVAEGESGLMAGFAPGAAWFDLSTNGVQEVREMHARLAQIDVDFLDAPISGGPAGAASWRSGSGATGQSTTGSSRLLTPWVIRPAMSARLAPAPSPSCATTFAPP